ncbi:hypothetical protein [Streptomyces sp. NRRL S-920]|uniref:hypothetical protein n=1 Tax=Streptomyces sp. NRRL S-920 TaxID=1463921 RepID=UPI000565FC7C|nr:hypothetical protein [Streptomyces sp. NRRL S-920]
MASTTQHPETDASQREYTTYAPPGETCPACRKPIKSLERCRRGEVERQSASPAVVYRHIDCNDPRETKRGSAQ